MSNLEIPASAAWYIRALMIHGVGSLERFNKEGSEWLESDEGKAAGVWASSVRGQIAHNEQLLREARDEFKSLPDELIADSVRNSEGN